MRPDYEFRTYAVSDGKVAVVLEQYATEGWEFVDMTGLTAYVVLVLLRREKQ